MLSTEDIQGATRVYLDQNDNLRSEVKYLQIRVESLTKLGKRLYDERRMLKKENKRLQNELIDMSLAVRNIANSYADPILNAANL